MRYTLWHADTGNLIGDFGSKVAALDAVRDEIETNDDADELILVQSQKGEKPVFLASGDALYRQAFTPRPRYQAAAH